MKSEFALLQEYCLSVDNTNIWLLLNAPTIKNDEEQASNHINHTHVFTEIFVCLDGEICIEAANNGTAKSHNLILHAGDCAFIPKDLDHHKVIDRTSAKWFSVGFAIKSKDRHVRSTLYKSLSRFFDTEYATVLEGQHAFCESIAKLFEIKHTNSSLILPMKFITALLELSVEKANEYTPFAYSEGSLSLLEYIIATRFMTKLSCKDAAKILHISERHLTRISKERYGKGFHSVLIDKRLDFSEYLLKNTDKKIEEIAFEAGFFSSESFKKAFISRHGVSPLSFNKRSP